MAERIMDRGQLRAALLRKLAQESVARSEQRGAEVRKKREERRAGRGAQAPVASIPDFDCVGDGRKSPPNAATVEEWWRAAMAVAFDGRVKHEKWTVAQLTLAKKLLATYGAEDVQRGIAETLATWAQHPGVVEGRLSAIPTINLLWGMRETIWKIPQAGLERSDHVGLVKPKKGATLSDREARRRERMATGEYNPKETDPKKRKGRGW